MTFAKLVKKTNPAPKTAVMVATVLGTELKGELDPYPVGSHSWVEIRDSEPGFQLSSVKSLAPSPAQTTIYSLVHKSGQPDSERHARLLDAEQYFDLIDLNLEHDLSAEILAAIPPHRRLISCEETSADLALLHRQLERMELVGAAFYRLTTLGKTVSESLDPLRFLHALDRKDVIAYDRNPTATWTRVLAAHLGAPVVFGQAGESGQCCLENVEPKLLDLANDYGLPNLHPISELFAIVGDPVQASLSPRLHNAAYRRSAATRLFLSITARDFDEFWQAMVKDDLLERIGMPLKGITMASPHKRRALQAANLSSSLSLKAKSSNVLVMRSKRWFADTTDPVGLISNLGRLGRNFCDEQIAIIGCGGSGRSMAAALREVGAEVTLVNRSIERGNRSLERGRAAGKMLNLPFIPLSQFSAYGYTILVNATPLGRKGEAYPVDLIGMKENSVIFDLIYMAEQTQLMRQAESLGFLTVDGRENLISQVCHQYRLMTGDLMSENLARGVVGMPNVTLEAITT